MYDNAEYLNISYPANLSPEEQLDVVTDTAKVKLKLKLRCAFAQILQIGLVDFFKPFVCLTPCMSQSLAEVATLVARSLYLQAGGAESQLSSITADPLTVRHVFDTSNEAEG